MASVYVTDLLATAERLGDLGFAQSALVCFTAAARMEAMETYIVATATAAEAVHTELADNDAS